jgi:hypothetical protein
MTKKDYIKLAAALAYTQPKSGSESSGTWRDTSKRALSVASTSAIAP